MSWTAPPRGSPSRGRTPREYLPAPGRCSGLQVLAALDGKAAGNALTVRVFIIDNRALETPSQLFGSTMSRFVIGMITLALAVACQKPSTSEAKTADPGAPVARWNGGTITAAELDAQMYEQRKQALDQLLVRKLVEQKAKAESTTPEVLWKREVTDKLKKPSDVEVTLKPPRVEVAAEGPSKGASSAPITIVEFSDFQCPYCSRAEETVTKVLKAYDGKVRVVYRDYPLPFHPQAEKAAEAAHCAGDQGKYWEMHSKLFANQKALEPPALKGYAKDLKLDQGKFDKCLDSGDKAKVVETNKKAGEKVGVTGTPAFFVNGYQLSGAQPFEKFKSIIDQELARK